jgi:hypothetical protein
MKKIVNESFLNSPSYQQVYINASAIFTEVWIVDDSDTKELKKLIMLPDISLNTGDLITWNGDRWLTLIVDNGEIQDSGSIQKCNAQITITTETIIYDGTDSLGRPIPVSTPSTTNYDCIVKSKTRISGDKDLVVNIPDGRVLISMSYDSSLNLDTKYEFKLYNQTWKITEVDYTNVDMNSNSGVFSFMAERNI